MSEIDTSEEAVKRMSERRYRFGIPTERQAIEQFLQSYRRRRRNMPDFKAMELIRQLERERDGWRGIAEGKDLVIAQERDDRCAACKALRQTAENGCGNG